MKFFQSNPIDPNMKARQCACAVGMRPRDREAISTREAGSPYLFPYLVPPAIARSEATSTLKFFEP